MRSSAPIALILLLAVAAAEAGPRRSLLRYGADSPDAAVDLNSTTFDAVLKDSPATFAVVEFFAHWCPACRNYKPHYEKVARLFNGPDAVHPGIIIMARVDCALKMNTDLCDRFSVVHYPMLLWGSPHKFLSGRWDPKQEKAEIQTIDDGRTADHLLNWINKKIWSSFGLDDAKYEIENTFPHNAYSVTSRDVWRLEMFGVVLEIFTRAAREGTSDDFSLVTKRKKKKSIAIRPVDMPPPSSNAGLQSEPDTRAEIEDLPPIKSIEEMTADYTAYLAKQGKAYYATPDDARRAGIDIGSAYTFVTKRKHKKSRAALAVDTEQTPKKDKRKKKRHTSTHDSDTTYTSEGTVRKTRNRATQEDLATPLDQLFKHTRSKSKGRIQQATEAQELIYTADEDDEPEPDKPEQKASNGDTYIPF